MKPTDLERYFERRLRRLPTPRAPSTLVPRVLAAIQEPALRPWYERSWPAWPRAFQAVSVVALIALLAGLAMLEPTIQAELSNVVPRYLGDTARRATDLTQGVQTTARAMSDLWRTLIQPVLGYLVTLVVLMSASCAALGAALARLALGGPPQPLRESE